MKSIRNSSALYWGLIIAFFALYLLVGFVSTLHSITFFELANTMWMAVLLGITYEIGQAAVLFSILMSDNNKKLLPWLLMFLLTALQVTANVYASFKFMDSSGNEDWTFWQRSILFWLEADGPEMFKVIISWISGALLPVVALGMTALVAENLKLKDEQEENSNKPIFDNKGNIEGAKIYDEPAKVNESKESEPEPKSKSNPSDIVDNLKKDVKETPMLKLGDKVKKIPKLHPRGWHLKKEHLDSNGDVYSFGKFVKTKPLSKELDVEEFYPEDSKVQTEPPKKA